MPNFTEPNRRDAPLISDASLAALLAGAELPPGTAAQLRLLAQVLAELAGRPVDGELDGEADPLAAFRNQLGTLGPAHGAGRKHRLRPRPLPLRAAAAVTAILALGGLATAAYAGVLPAGLQHLAHDIIGAPATGTQPAGGPSPAIPAATGHSGYGLCTAWARDKAHGDRKQQAAVFRELAAAAGGRGNVTAYCTGATTRPSSRPSPAPSPLQHSGKPSARPTPQGPAKPTGLPTPRGSGKPTGLPTPRGSGKPTGLPTPRG
jgi:hypothetical protein